MRTLAHRLHALPWVLALALLIKAMVPAGFMPSSGHWVELCTVEGVVHVWTDQDSSDPPAPSCPWLGVVPFDMGSMSWHADFLRSQTNDPLTIHRAMVALSSRWTLPALRAPPIVS